MADSPTGPFKDALGKPLFDNGSWDNIDPTVWMDEDAECLHINKGVAHLLQVEVAAIVTCLGLETTHLVGLHGECIDCCLVVW